VCLGIESDIRSRNQPGTPGLILRANIGLKKKTGTQKKNTPGTQKNPLAQKTLKISPGFLKIPPGRKGNIKRTHKIFLKTFGCICDKSEAAGFASSIHSWLPWLLANGAVHNGTKLAEGLFQIRCRGAKAAPSMRITRV